MSGAETDIFKIIEQVLAGRLDTHGNYTCRQIVADIFRIQQEKAPGAGMTRAEIWTVLARSGRMYNSSVIHASVKELILLGKAEFAGNEPRTSVSGKHLSLPTYRGIVNNSDAPLPEV